MRQIRGLFGSVAMGVLLLAIAFISLSRQTSANRPDYERPDVQRTSLPPAPGQSQRWEVVKVSDGDTLTVRSDGREQKVRLCGIDAPESKQPLGSASKARLQQLITAADGQIILMKTDRDRYGRMVAEAFIRQPDGSEQSLQEEMLMAGMAYVYPAYVNSCPNANAFKAAEAIAQDRRVGVWDGNHQKPWDYRNANR